MPVSERVDAALPFSSLSAAFQAFVYTHYNFIEHARKWQQSKHLGSLAVDTDYVRNDDTVKSAVQ